MTALSVAEVPLDAPEVAQLWTGLQAAGCVRSAFLRWEWHAAMTQSRTQSGTQSGARSSGPPKAVPAARVLVVRSGPEPVGLFPISVERGPGVLRAAGAPGWRWLAPDHLDVVCRREDACDVAAAIVDHLAAARWWDLLDLDAVSTSSALAGALRRLRPPRYVRRRDEAVTAPYLALPGRSGSAIHDVLPGRNLRQQVTRGLRAAERAGGGLVVAREPADVGSALDELMALHNDRFGAASSVFATEARRAFHRAAAAHLASAGAALVYRLRAHDADAALLYALRHERVVYYYAMGWRPDLVPSPGRTVLGLAALSAAEDGAAEFDLLRGDHQFKLRFATGIREDLRCRVLRADVRAAVTAATVTARRITAALRSR